MGDVSLSGKTVAVLATDGYEQVELDQPVAALRDAGARVEILAPQTGSIQGFNHHDKGGTVTVDRAVAKADPAAYAALVLPGGVINPDQLRLEPDAIAFITAFGQTGKPIAAICHGPWPLIDAGLVKDRRLTSWPSLKTDLSNAGASWVDEPAVVDRGLLTSRKPDDLDAFCAELIRLVAETKSD
ncbi:MAG: type 1 glutamine amidotransferase domain-containing protein [Phenylobacterium sp.]|nr:type 1 glutamine amidotransferase domain-containing protein [Phenylobacterium sp.]